MIIVGSGLTSPALSATPTRVSLGLKLGQKIPVTLSPSPRLMSGMNKLFTAGTLALVAASSLLMTGCVVRERRVYHHAPPAYVSTEVTVTEAPPPMVVETVTVAPGPGFVWIRGGWVWRNHWVWERGHWANPPRPGAIWVDPHYEYRHGAHVFICGGWRF